jgi:hypothetical protein
MRNQPSAGHPPQIARNVHSARLILVPAGTPEHRPARYGA